MKPTEGYILRSLHGVHYLLPIGQNIALHKKSIRLNDTGVLLWHAICQGVEEDELLPYLRSHFHDKETDIETIKSDIAYFLGQLSALHLIASEPGSSSCNRKFQIGNIIIGYHGPDALLSPCLLSFACAEGAIQQHWYIESHSPDYFPKGELLIRTSEIEIQRGPEDYTLTFLPASQLISARITLDGTSACFYCSPPFNEALTGKLFHAFRFAFLIYAQQKGLFALHSASILYHGQAWLFAAASGTGKSTHAELWHRYYQTPVINGDLNLIGFKDSQPVAYGLPWCGTSGIYSAHTHPLGGIILLKQNTENIIQELSRDKQQLQVMQRLINPAWTEQMADINLKFSGELSEQTHVFQFLCTKESSAAAILKQKIDELTKNTEKGTALCEIP